MKTQISVKLPWPFLVGAKFTQIHPIGTLFSVLLALLSQFAVIGAFMLPIKIVMLMGGEGIPGAFPLFIQDVDKKIVISVLAALSVASYIFYQLSTKAIEAITLAGTRIIEKRNQKLHLFEGQHEFTRKSYEKYIDAIASCSFISLGTIFLFIIYPETGVVFLFYIFMCVLVAFLVLGRNSKNYDIDTVRLQKQLPTFVGAGFFLIFLWILIDYIYLTIPDSFLVLLVSILLGRQLLSQAAVAVNSLIFLNNNKQKLKAVLLHGEVLHPAIKKADTFWEFLNPNSIIHEQLHFTLSSVCNIFDTGVRIEWEDSGLPGVAFLTAKAEYNDGFILIKIFDRNKSAEALHEAALLLEEPENLPSPKLMATRLISGHHVHFFNLKGCIFYTKVLHAPEKNELTLSISNASLPIDLTTRYERSHRMLWDRLDDSLLKRIMVASTEKFSIKEFQLQFLKIKDVLKNQPLCLYNPHIDNANLWVVHEENGYMLLHWGRWSIEPYGAGLGPRYLHSIKKNEGGSDHETFSSLDSKNVNALIISSLSLQLVRQVASQQLKKAIKTSADLAELLNQNW